MVGRATTYALAAMLVVACDAAGDAGDTPVSAGGGGVTGGGAAGVSGSLYCDYMQLSAADCAAVDNPGTTGTRVVPNCN